MKNKKQKQNRGVGRPSAVINYPNRKFTFTDLVNINKHVTPLCLRHNLKKDADLGRKSEIIKLAEKRQNGNGIGRKLEVYQKRSMAKGKRAKRKTVSKTITVPVVNITSAPAPVSPASPEFKALVQEVIGSTPVAAPVEAAPVAAPIAEVAAPVAA